MPRRLLPLRHCLVGAAVFVASAATLLGNATPDAGGGSTPTFDPKIAALLPAGIEKSKHISFGALWETPPVIALDPKDPNRPVGLAVDLINAVSRVLGVTPVYRNMQWPAQIPGLESGAIDVLWGQISDTKDRERSIADIIPWMQEPLAILVAKGNPKGIKDMSSVCGLKIAVPTGSTQEALVQGSSGRYCSGNSAASTVDYPGAQEAVVALKAGTVDGWIDSASAIEDIVKSSPNDFQMVTIPNAQVTAFTSNVSGIAVSKRNPQLTRALAAALKEIAAPGGAYATIMKTWGASGAALRASAIRVNPFTRLPAGKKA